MIKVNVIVNLRENILDPSGSAIKTSLHKMGYENVNNVRIGKYITLTLEDEKNIDENINNMCQKLLANTVIEDYTYTIEKE